MRKSLMSVSSLPLTLHADAACSPWRLSCHELDEAVDSSEAGHEASLLSVAVSRRLMQVRTLKPRLSSGAADLAASVSALPASETVPSPQQTSIIVSSLSCAWCCRLTAARYGLVGF